MKISNGSEKKKIFISYKVKKRLVIGQLQLKVYDAMMAMEKYLATSTLELGLIELIRLRASQINGCAYCIQIHSEGALKHGESQVTF